MPLLTERERGVGEGGRKMRGREEGEGERRVVGRGREGEREGIDLKVPSNLGTLLHTHTVENSMPFCPYQQHKSPFAQIFTLF